MKSALTNLLSETRRHEIARDHRYRIGVVALVLVMLLIAAAGVLLVPSYVFLVGSASAKEAHLAQIKSTLTTTEDQALAAQLKTLSSDTALLLELSKQTSASKTMAALLEVSRPGIVISNFTYTALQGAKPGTVELIGTAATRDALRNYQIALQGLSIVQSARLPVSAYAKDTDITFAITITLVP